MATGRRLTGAALAAIALGGAAACTTPPPGQDLRVSVGGDWGPGYANVGWAAVGPEAVTGPTTITLTVVSGPMTIKGAMYTDVDRDYWITGSELTPDGRTLTVRFDGTTAPDRGRFFKFSWGGWAEGATGIVRATVANANDTNPANDVAERTYLAAGPFPTTTTTTTGG